MVPRESEAETTLAEWTEGIAARNAETIVRCEKFRCSADGSACWAKTIKEIDAGWLTPPVRLTPTMAESLSLSPRFAIFEERGDGPQKVRVIDDLGASGVNGVTATHDTAVPDSLDCVLALSVYFRLLSPGCVLQAASTDFRHAYKTIGIPPGHERFPAILSAPPERPMQVSHLRTQPFGSKSAPGNWGRVTALFKWILMNYFSAHLPIYVDDCFIIATAETIQSAAECVRTLAELCGFGLDKDQSHSDSLAILGARVHFGPEGVSATLPEKRRGSLIHDLECILASGELSPGQADKMRGRLGFAQSLMFGKLGRVQLHPFSNRQYSSALRGTHAINAELMDVIPWWIHVLRSVSPRCTMTPGPRPVLIYTDASGCGHLGVIAYVGGETHVFSSHAPEWVMKSKCDIYDLEMAATLRRAARNNEEEKGGK